MFHATQYYQKYLETNPSHLEARRKLASCYRKVGNYTACISCLDKIPSDSINHEDMRMYYYAYLNQNNNDKVSLWGERIAFLFPYDSEIIASLAVHYNGVNKPDRAEKVTKNYISQCDSTNLYVNKEYAYSLFMQFKYDEAIPRCIRKLPPRAVPRIFPPPGGASWPCSAPAAPVRRHSPTSGAFPRGWNIGWKKPSGPAPHWTSC